LLPGGGRVAIGRAGPRAVDREPVDRRRIENGDRRKANATIA